MHVDPARDHITAPRIDDLRDVATAIGEPRADRRDGLAPDRNVGPRFALGTEEDSIRDHDVVIHGGSPSNHEVSLAVRSVD